MYRKLTKEEIAILQTQNCWAEKWQSIEVSEKFSLEYIHNVCFSGNIKLGQFESIFTFDGGVQKHSGLCNATLHNCEIGDDVLIENVHSYLANYKIGNHTFIGNVDRIFVDEKSAFGNGVEVAILNEAGGRKVKINDLLSSPVAYILALYRYDSKLIEKLNAKIDKYSKKLSSSTGTIGNHVFINNTGSIKNVRIGDNARIEGAFRLENGSINSNEYDSVHIGCSVIAEDFIVSSGSEIEDGTMLTRCFVGQACRLGHAFSAVDSLFFSNCQGENGEACAVFAGPYTVTHHKSTLLIAGMFSFMNVGSGSNQSNHNYKLGPVHQGIIERGGKLASDSYLFWPAKIGPFSLIKGRHYNHPDTSDLPFSYLLESEGETLLVPAVNLKSVGTIRDVQKFLVRDKRKDPNQLDPINFGLLTPYSVQKIINGVEILKDLQKKQGVNADFYHYHNCKITHASLQKGLDLYDKAIRKFLGDVFLSRLESSATSIKDIRNALQLDTPYGSENWRDLSGVLLPESIAEKIIDDITDSEISLEGINRFFEKAHAQYDDYTWTWVSSRIQSYYNVDFEMITPADIIRIIEDWNDAVAHLNKLIFKDAEKEFSETSRVGYGADGLKEDQSLDFENVRGSLGKDAFVMDFLQEADKAKRLSDKIMKEIKDINIKKI